MSEIEKMMQNVVGKVCTHTIINPAKCNHRRMTRCYGCDWLGYPPFTAEKQLLLIQLLAETRPIHINLLLDKWTIEGMVRYGIKYDTFEDALSGYINQIWQDLTEEEKQQVKGILE